MEFAPQSATITRLQAGTSDAMQIYNGTEYFILDTKEKTLDLEDKIDPKRVNSLIVIHNSIATLKSSLNSIIRDDSITKIEHDTVIAQKRYTVVSIGMHNKAIDYLNQFRKFSIVMTVYYDLIIDPITYLPYQLIEKNSVDGATYFTRNIYTEINTHPTPPKELSWYYSSYQHDYKRKPKEKSIPLIAAGATLPAWSLPGLGSKDGALVNSAAFTNKIVLLDFWIKNCGYCMQSFPYLNELQDKYGRNNVQILAVNTYDSKEDVVFFYKREKPDYQMLYDGKALAKQLGVDDRGYPTVLVTDKAGKIVYAGSFEKEKIDSLIKSNL
jgi:thiol-disulfide isomerase/thioredoxin